MMPVIIHKMQPGQIRLPVPYGQYIVTNKGEVKNLKTWKWLKQSKAKTKRGHYVLRVSLRNTATGKYDVHVLKDLMARCWCDVPEGFNRWDWSIAVNATLNEVTDDPMHDIRPDNLVWNPAPKKPLKVRNIAQRAANLKRMEGPDFKKVPGYSDYCITREGVVGRLSSARIWQPPINLMHRLRMINDLGVGITRRACYWVFLAYGDAPPDDCECRLGFRDNDPTNTDLSNLYWIEWERL